MPPKVRITKEDIITTSVNLVRVNGVDSINARAIASALNCSTQPIFSNFSSMEELEDSTIKSAYEIYLSFIKKEVESAKYPKYKSFGMAYIRFAKEEKELFKLLFMRDRSGEDITPTTDFEESVQMIMKANNLNYEDATLIHLKCWACVHGIATMIVTSFLLLDEELISNLITDVYKGITTKYS
jgi:AcrR family transcriptional regulator